MQVNIFGIVRRAAQISVCGTFATLPLERRAGNINEWYQVKFVGTLVESAVAKFPVGKPVSLTGILTYEDSTSTNGVSKLVPLLTVNSYLGNFATANLTIMTIRHEGANILGTAIDNKGTMLINYSIAANSDYHQSIVPEANVIVSGLFRLGKEPGTIGMRIEDLIAVISTPEIPAIDPIEPPLDVEIPDVVEPPLNVEIPDVVEPPLVVEIADAIESPLDVEIADAIESPSVIETAVDAPVTFPVTPEVIGAVVNAPVTSKRNPKAKAPKTPKTGKTATIA